MIINIISNYVKNLFPNKYNFTNKNQKYELPKIIREILYVLETGVSWRKYRGPLKWQSLYYHYNFFSCPR